MIMSELWVWVRDPVSKNKVENDQERVLTSRAKTKEEEEGTRKERGRGREHRGGPSPTPPLRVILIKLLPLHYVAVYRGEHQATSRLAQSVYFQHGAQNILLPSINEFYFRP